ncbi:MAG: hypothetical protein HDT43_08545 [Ruminococcaceae bacterium]|nr:hypothetical protein [Oscillospiraceae bacterium]
MDKDKKTKGLVIGVCIAALVVCVIFSAYAGTRVGTDIGEFIYNVNH